MKHEILIAVTLNSYCTIQVEAPTAKEAERLVQESFRKDHWDSPYYQQAEDWDTGWNEADDLRIV